MKCSFVPYEGKEKYIFISYSHSDGEIVAPILERLNDKGFRIWYDDGIEWGSEWPESVASHLHNCEICMVFHSKKSIKSSNCRREINYALKTSKNVLSVYLENVELGKGMDMQLTSYQSAFLFQYDNMDLFLEKLLKTQMLQSCRGLLTNSDTKDENSNILDNTFEFDEELDEKFNNIVKENLSEKSKLIKKIEDIKINNFINELANNLMIYNTEEIYTYNDEISLTPPEYQYGNSYGDESCVGKHFILPNIKDTITRVFQIYKVFDYKTLSKYYECELLESSSEEINANNINETTYYIEDPQRDGNTLLFLHFRANEVYINTGLLLDDKLKIGRPDLMVLNYNNNSIYLNSAEYNIDILSDKELSNIINDNTEVDFDTNIRENAATVIDPLTGAFVKRELYYNNVLEKWKAKIKIHPYKSYFAFKIFTGDSKEYKPKLTNLEIASCYRNGTKGFPKDIIKAVEYLEKENTALSMYEISDIFRNEESVCDFGAYSEYLTKAMSMGCIQAIIEDIINKYINLDISSSNSICGKLSNLEDESGLKDFVIGYLIENSYFKDKKNDVNAAYNFYIKSASKDFKPAYVRLGCENFKLDSYELKKAYTSDNGVRLALAEYAMGCVLFYGLGINPKEDYGIHFLKKAACLGSKMASKELFHIYNNMSKYLDKNEALKWLMVAEKFDESFSNELAYRLWTGIGCEINDINDKIAYDISEEMAIKGDKEAKHNLGWANKMGRGCKVNYKKAMTLFMEAERADSYYYIADMYENGLGLEVDKIKALEYYKLAANKGSKKAVAKLDKMRFNN